MYAAQQSTQRAFASGHNVTASTAVNFCSDVLGRILLDALSQRAESASALLKPGDGLLPGQGGLGQAAFAVMTSAQKGISRKVTISGAASNEETIAKQEIDASIAKACAHLNDIEVAADYTQRLEDKLNSEVQSSFPSSRPETEHLKQCIKSLDSVIDSLKNSSDGVVDHLVNILMPRVRSMVNEFVGQEASGAAGYTNVLSAGVTSTMQNVKMNYNLDEKAFEMSQICESYMTLLCQQMEELIEPLRLHLAPRLADLVVLGVVGGISKRLEMAIKRVSFTIVCFFFSFVPFKLHSHLIFRERSNLDRVNFRR
jgi:phage shock protein PspC (stress-responsive transcriptional regulator)